MTEPFFSAVQARRSIYKLDAKSPVSDERIQEIVTFAIKHCPSAFNVQSARAVILFRDQHQKLWDMGDAMLKKSMPDGAYKALAPKVQGYKAGYGTVLWFEDETDLMLLKQQNPMIAGTIPEWSQHSTGMHQFTVWTALTAEGFGCNLQHYNFSPQFTADVLEEWKLPKTWVLYAQLVFGTPTAGPDRVKTFKDVDERVKVF